VPGKRLSAVLFKATHNFESDIGIAMLGVELPEFGALNLRDKRLTRGFIATVGPDVPVLTSTPVGFMS
jgi:hypothetical protein